MALAMLTVHTVYADIVGGAVYFEPSGWRADATAGKVYPPARTTATVAEDGSVSIRLRGSDIDVEPPYTYLVTEKLKDITGRTVGRDPYEITLPTADDGSSVDLASLQPDDTWDAADIAAPTFAGGSSTGGF